MSAISSFMTMDHRACDADLAKAETLVQKQQWAEAQQAWLSFERAMRCHFAREEDLLFPAFENATGHRQGPTAVMRMEHEQMRALLGSMAGHVQSRDGRGFLSLSDTLMVLIQQHNMKEEQILYPMCDRMLPDAAGMLARLEALRPDQG